MPIKQNSIIGIIGPKGSGKTVYAARLYGAEERAVVFNVAYDTEYSLRSKFIIEEDVHSLERIMEREEKAGYRIAFETEYLSPGAQGQVRYVMLPGFLKRVYAQGDLSLYLDEAHQICSPWSAPFELLRVIRMGRHKEINIVWVSQRFAAVHRELTANTDQYVFFRMGEPRDLDQIEARCGLEVTEKVSKLRRIAVENGRVIPGEILKWNPWDGYKIETPEAKRGRQMDSSDAAKGSTV